MNNFIKLTTLDKDTTLILNSMFIQSIHEQENNSSYIIMSLKEDHSHFHVKESIDEIMKKIDKSNRFTTITK